MEGSGLNGMGAMPKKRRSGMRRPQSNPWLDSGACIMPGLSSSNARRFSPYENGCSESSLGKKEVCLNNPPPRSFAAPAANIKKVTEVDKLLQESHEYSTGGMSRGVGHLSVLKNGNEDALLAPIKWKRTSKVFEGLEMKSGSGADDNVGKSGEDRGTNCLGQAPYGASENKLRKVKLKVGGVTRTIHAKSHLQSTNVRSQDIFDDHSPREKGDNCKGDHWKDSSSLNFPRGTKEDISNKVVQGSLSGKQAETSEPTRKSKRVPKKRVFDEVVVDDKNLYVEKHKAYKVAANHIALLEDNGEKGVKNVDMPKHSKFRNPPYEESAEYFVPRPGKKNRKKSRQGGGSDDIDYVEEEEPVEDDVAPDSRGKKQKTTFESSPEFRNEPLTTRQRALQSGKAGNGESLIEFPTGLPSAPSRKQKEKLSQDEIQAKKAEAAQRRKMQVEKQARESEAAAIRKILGQDSDKKKEEKKQKELEEKAKAVGSQTLQPNTIRWVMGPTGTVVTFADDVGFPEIFSSEPISYPPPREKCAGPSCTNVYKYRDSKTKLPLCSLQCYRAIHGSA